MINATTQVITFMTNIVFPAEPQPRVNAEEKRAAIREMPVKWLITLHCTQKKADGVIHQPFMCANYLTAFLAASAN